MGVVLLHLTTDFHKFFAPLRRSVFDFDWGAYGVHLFFMISGFVILMTVEKMKTVREFLYSRFTRLYPPYWVAIAFTLTILLFAPLDGGTPPIKLIHRAIVDTTMFQGWVGIGSIDSVYWTLQVELSFYLIMTLLIAFKAVDRALIVMTALVVLGLIDHLIVPRPLSAAYTYFRQLAFLETSYLFTTGVVIYRMSQTGFKSFYVPILLLCISTPLTANYFPNTPPRDTMIYIVLATVLYLATVGKLRWLVITPLTFLGGISYSLYLTHHWLGLTLLKKADEHGVNPDLALVVALIVCVFVATVSTYFVERPSLKWLRQRVLPQRKIPASPSPHTSAQ